MRFSPAEVDKRDEQTHFFLFLSRINALSGRAQKQEQQQQNSLGEPAGVGVGVEAVETPQYLKFARSCVAAVSQPASQRHSQGGTGAPCPEQSGGPKGQVRAGAGVGVWRGGGGVGEWDRERQ